MGGQIWVVGVVIVAERQRVTGCRLSPYDAARHSRDISAHIRTDEISHTTRNNERDKKRKVSRRGGAGCGQVTGGLRPVSIAIGDGGDGQHAAGQSVRSPPQPRAISGTRPAIKSGVVMFGKVQFGAFIP